MTEIISTNTTLEQYDPSPIDWQGVPGSGNFAAIPPGTGQIVGFTAVPVTPPWPTNDTLLALAGGATEVLTADAYITLATCQATDNADGSGISYALTGQVSPGNATTVFGNNAVVGLTSNDVLRFVLIADNPTDHTLYLQSLTGTVIRFVIITHTTTIDPGTPPPTVPPPPPNLPPEVVQRKLLDAANPGFNCEITRDERLTDLVTLFLGDKISLSFDGIRGRLGMVGRSHVVTRLRFRWQVVHGGDTLAEQFTTTATLEKIAGTLLGGAGSSTPTQDAAFDGGDLSLFSGWDGAGWETAGWGA